MTTPPSRRQDQIVDAIEQRVSRTREARRLPSVVRNLGQIGVLGWQIVLPGLIGLAAGRGLDRHFMSGIFWTAGLLVCGLALGCWSAWRWVQRQ